MEWRYREYRGPNDAVAPNHGAYWITDEDDLVARVWHDDMADAWRWDVTEAGEIEYGGTPCSLGTTKTRAEAQADAVECLLSCLKR